MTILYIEGALVATALARSVAIGLVGAGSLVVTVWSLRPHFTARSGPQEYPMTHVMLRLRGNGAASSSRCCHLHNP